MTREIFEFDGPNQEWLAKRREYLTSTDMASIFQLGNKSVAKVIEEKLNPPEMIKNEFMLIGNILEPAVLKAFQLRAGIDAQPADPSKIVMVCDSKNRIAATPDGKYFDGDEWHIVECKTTGSADLSRAKVNFNKWRDGVPLVYLIQVHTQLLVTGLKSGFIGCMSYFYPVPFIAYQVIADDAIAEMLIEEAQRFWRCFEEDTIFSPIDPERKNKLISLLNNSQSLYYVSHEVV